MATSMPVPKQRQPRTYKRTCEKTRASELVDRRLQAPSPPLHDPKRTVCPRAAGWRRLVVPEALDRGHQNLRILLKGLRVLRQQMARQEEGVGDQGRDDRAADDGGDRSRI